MNLLGLIAFFMCLAAAFAGLSSIYGYDSGEERPAPMVYRASRKGGRRYLRINPYIEEYQDSEELRDNYPEYGRKVDAYNPYVRKYAYNPYVRKYA